MDTIFFINDNIIKHFFSNKINLKKKTLSLFSKKKNNSSCNKVMFDTNI